MRDRGTFDWTVAPKLNGEPCPFVVVEGNLAKRVVGLSLIREDLQAVRESFVRMRRTTDDLVGSKLLLFGATALYGKCFTQADGRGVTLNPKAVFHRTETKESHERLMQMRHNFVAHGGKSREEQLKIVLLLDPDERKKALRGIVGHGLSAHGLDETACDECLETVDEAIMHVNQSLQRANEAFVSHVADLGIEWAYRHAIWPEANKK